MYRTLRALAATFALALVGLGLAACSTADSAAPAPTTADVVGVWGDPAAAGTTSLEFSADGRVTGTDGCNRITGSWQLSDTHVTFGPLAATLMACDGVDTWLIDPHDATVAGDTLTIRNSAGTTVGTLNRA